MIFGWGSASAGDGSDEEALARLRASMVKRHLASRDIKDPRVLAAMGKVGRHHFVPEKLRRRAYEDRPLPIGERQTISQPYIVAFMTQALELKGTERVLEIGTGSGYQAAVLAEVAAEVYSIEILAGLAERAGKVLQNQGYGRIHTRTGDGYQGWPEAAPFDAIIVTAAPDHVPKPLVDQLKPGGRLVLPVGDQLQEIRRIRKGPKGLQEESLLPVRFVPMTGEAMKPRPARKTK